MGKAGLAVCVGFVLGGTCVCVLVGGNGVFCLFVFFLLSDEQGCVRWYVFRCLWEVCLLMIGFIFVLLVVWVRHPVLDTAWQLSDDSS